MSLYYSSNFLIFGVDVVGFCFNKATVMFCLLPSSGNLNLLSSATQQTLNSSGCWRWAGWPIDYLCLTKRVVKTDFIEVAGSYRIVAACCCQNRTFLCVEPGKSDVFQRFLNTCNRFWFRIMCSKAKKEMHEQFHLCTLSSCLSFLVRCSCLL